MSVHVCVVCVCGVYTCVSVYVYLDHERAPFPSRIVTMSSYLGGQRAESGAQRLWGQAGAGGCLMGKGLGSTQQPTPTDQMGSRLL